MAYEKRTWVSGSTKCSAENFNHMEDGIETAQKGVDELNTKIAGTFSATSAFADKDNTLVRIRKRANIVNVSGYLRTASTVTSGQVIGFGYITSIGTIPEETQVVFACDTGAVTFGSIKTDGVLQIVAATAGAHYYRFNATMVV